MPATRHGEPAPALATETRAIGVISLIAMLRMFGLFAILPVLALYVKDLEGATPLLVGIAVGGYGLTQAGLQIPMGALSDRIGRGPVIVGGLAVFAFGSVVAATGTTIWTVIGGRLLQGAGAISSTLTALMADATRESIRTRAMAVLGVGIGTSFLLALIGGPAIAAWLGIPALFWMAATLALVAALLYRALPDGIEPPARRRDWSLRPALRRDLLQLDASICVLHTLLTASFVALPFLFTQRLGMPYADHWKVYVGALLASLLGTVPLVVADDRQGKAATIGLAVGLLLAGQLLLAFGSVAVWSVFLALSLFFAGFNFLEAGLPARLSMLAQGDVRGASLGVFASCQFFGAFVGGVLGGRILAGGRPTEVFAACAALAAAWLAVVALFRRS